MRRRSETCIVLAVALISSTLGFSFAGAQQKVAREETSGTKDRFNQNFLAQHEIGRRFRIDPAELPPPKASAIVTNRVDDSALRGTSATGPAGLHCNTVCDWSRKSKAATRPAQRRCSGRRAKRGYLTLLRDDGTGKATWINRHVEDPNKPYGLAWQNDHVLLADQDGIWSVPHVVGALRAGERKK